MNKWDGLNRRKFPRVNYPCLIVMRNDGRETEALLTHTENLGIGGVCIILKKDIKMFSPVTLELDLLDLGNHIKCEGKVVWNVRRRTDATQKPTFFDIGIEFQDIDKKDKERLEDVVGQLLEKNEETPYT